MAQGAEDRPSMNEEQLKELLECVVADSIKQERASIAQVATFSIHNFLQHCRKNSLDPLHMDERDLLIFITSMAFAAIPDVYPMGEDEEKEVM